MNAARALSDSDSNFGPNLINSSPPLNHGSRLLATMAGPPVIIWAQEVERLLHCRELVPRLEAALGKFSRRDSAEVIQPVRSTVPLQKHNG